MSKRIPAVILGAAGLVGQRFVQLLNGHPWFEVTALTGSERYAGQRYGAACKWVLDTPMPEWASEMVVLPSDPGAVKNVRLAFSALPGEAALSIETCFAHANLVVCSNASAFRQEDDVPLLLPEVNPDHVELIPYQQQRRGWRGCIVTNPNCTCTGLTVTLKALHDSFGVSRVLAVSLQALSGAGYPGVPAMEILDNVIPNIEGEEEKVEWEPRKMLGKINGSQLSYADITISAHANRVPVSDGHLVCVSVELEAPASLEDAAEALRYFQAPSISSDLPSTPKPPIAVLEEPDRPQPKRDRLAGKGMTTVVGRVRHDSVLHLKYVVLSHNTIRGAAGGSIYNAELLVKKEVLK